MKIINLTEKSYVYTCNVYLVLGTWNTLPDVNTLVDVGRDPKIIKKIETTYTGVGKKQIEQVVLTHRHYDHAENLPLVKKGFNPVVYAFSSSLNGVDQILSGGEHLKMGDRIFEIIHIPGHSQDSICLYCEQDRTLFSGDTSLNSNSPGNNYEEAYIKALEDLCCRDIQIIYPGHGQPLMRNCNDIFCNMLNNIKYS